MALKTGLNGVLATRVLVLDLSGWLWTSRSRVRLDGKK